MTAFVDQFAVCVSRERQRLGHIFGPTAADEQERLLRDALLAAWRPLVPQRGSARRVFAADGSQAIRHFNNGWAAIICHGLCIGPGIEAPSVDVRFVRSTLPEMVLN